MIIIAHRQFFGPLMFTWLLEILPVSHHPLIRRVEDGRGSVKLRFPSPLIKPDMRSYRIRLSDWLHPKAHGVHHMGALRVHLIPLRLRLTVKLSLESPKLSGVYRPKGQSPLLVSFKSIPEARGLPSIGITRLHQYYSPLRLPPGPIHNRIVAGRDPASGTGLPRCPRYLPNMLSPLPRWIGNRWFG